MNEKMIHISMVIFWWHRKKFCKKLG